MNLKRFIEELIKIKKEQGENLEVIMADGIPVMNPVFSEKYYGKKVVITDEK